MDSIKAKLHSNVNDTNTSLWRLWYSTNAGTSAVQLGAAAISTITPVSQGTGYVATVVLTDANYMDGNIIRAGDTVQLICSGADTRFSTQETPVLTVANGTSITVALPYASYSGSATTGTLLLRNKVRKALFAGCSRTGTANATTAVTFGPAYGTLALPFSVPAASAVASVTVEEPQGSSFYLSDWNYKLGTGGDSLFVIYK